MRPNIYQKLVKAFLTILDELPTHTNDIALLLVLHCREATFAECHEFATSTIAHIWERYHE